MRCCLNAQAQGEHWSCEKDELLVILCLKMQHDLRGSMGLSIQRFLIKLFSIDVKGGGNATKGVYQVIKGRVLPSMPKGETVGILSLMAKDMAKEMEKVNRKEQRTNRRSRDRIGRVERRSRILVNNHTHSRRKGEM